MDGRLSVGIQTYLSEVRIKTICESEGGKIKEKKVEKQPLTNGRVFNLCVLIFFSVLFFSQAMRVVSSSSG